MNPGPGFPTALYPSRSGLLLGVLLVAFWALLWVTCLIELGRPGGQPPPRPPAAVHEPRPSAPIASAQRN